MTWWSSAFDHARKARRSLAADTFAVAPGYRIIALDGGGYPRNICLRRIRDHYRLARQFARRAPLEEPPDLVLSSFPPIELTAEAVKFASERGIPSFVDICDTWPDAFAHALPGALRPAGRALTLPWNRQVSSTMRAATGLLAISDAYLGWGRRKAARGTKPQDAVFIHAYQQLLLTPGEQKAQEYRWRERGVRPESFICCFFGTLSWLRDIGTVIEAARVLEWQGAPVQFILGGVGDEADHFRALAAGLPNVFFPGWVDGPAIASMLSMSRVGLIPYRSRAPQSLPNKPFEYFSAGLPVLSSLAGEMEDIIRDHQVGLSYRAGDVGDFLEKLDHLMREEPSRRSMGANALRLFDQTYRAETVYDALIRHVGAVPLERR